MAGIAYAGTRGIQSVAFSTDGGETWQSTELVDLPMPGQDRWTGWRGRFTLAAGAHAKLVARATDGMGQLQVEAFSLPEPDGGTGWPSLEVGAV